MYNVFLSTRGIEELVFRGTLAEASKYENNLRKECRRIDPDGTEMDCYSMSDEDMEKAAKSIKVWDSLTEEQKQDIIEVDGHRYVRAIYELNHK